jgi:hypothetical protein
MKAVILAAAMTVILFAAITASFRMFGRDGGLRRMIGVYLLCGGGLVLLWFATSSDLSFLPLPLLTGPAWLDLAVAVFLFSAAFFGGILQFYNLADRGFSLRFLIDISESPGAAMTADGLMTGYSRGKGIGWMYRKRLDGLLDGGFVERRGGDIALTGKGEAAAALFLRARRLLCPQG